MIFTKGFHVITSDLSIKISNIITFSYLAENAWKDLVNFIHVGINGVFMKIRRTINKPFVIFQT